MYALDYMSNGNNGIFGGEEKDLIATPTPRSQHTNRTRSNSLSSSMSEARVKAPHTEGHIKWLTTMYVCFNLQIIASLTNQGYKNPFSISNPQINTLEVNFINCQPSWRQLYKKNVLR